MQSRYYDPLIGRFINADALVCTGQGILGNNMFAYCLNNPVCMADYDGEDAIYVVTTGDDGLPIVGHAILFIQDADGNWYKTHFTGNKKRFAKVYTSRVSEEYIQDYLSANGRYSLYISGDFSASYELAHALDGTNYGGYHLFLNNCLHYVKEILSAGLPETTWYDSVIRSSEICPMGFYIKLIFAQLLGMRSSSSQSNSYTGNSGVRIYRGGIYERPVC